MKSRFLLFVFTILMGFGLIMGQISTAAAQSQSSDKSKSSSQKNKKTMDQRRKDQADKTINDMIDRGASQSDIQVQKKANKKYYGHEGE